MEVYKFLPTVYLFLIFRPSADIILLFFPREPRTLQKNCKLIMRYTRIIYYKLNCHEVVSRNNTGARVLAGSLQYYFSAGCVA